MRKNAVIRFTGQPRGRRTDAVAALTFLLERGYRRAELIRYHLLQDGTGEQCTWRYEHPRTGATATLRIFYPNTED